MVEHSKPMKIIKHIFIIVLLISSVDIFSQQLIFEDTFENGLNHWVIEKWKNDIVNVDIQNGELHVLTKKGVDGVMIWNNAVVLPENFKFEYDFTPVSASGFFLIFFCQQYHAGADILSRLDSIPSFATADDLPVTLFNKYVHWKIDGYHISYRRNQTADCNFRKNTGLQLLRKQQLNYLLPQNKMVHIVLTKQGSRFVLKVDNNIYMDYTDDGRSFGPVLEGGRIGLRQVYDSEGNYDNVKLWDLDHSKNINQ